MLEAVLILAPPASLPVIAPVSVLVRWIPQYVACLIAVGNHLADNVLHSVETRTGFYCRIKKFCRELFIVAEIAPLERMSG